MIRILLGLFCFFRYTLCIARRKKAEPPQMSEMKDLQSLN